MSQLVLNYICMKNKISFSLVISLTLCSLPDCLNAQLVRRNLNLDFVYNIGNFSGSEMSNDNSFIYPNLYSNFSDLNGFSIKATYKIHSLFSVGIEGGDLMGTNWFLKDFNLYDGATVNLRSVSPLFQIHTKFKESGILNRLKLYGEVAPVFGQAKLQLKNPIFEINTYDESESDFMKSTDNYFGIKGSTGIEFAFSKDAGVTLSYSVQQNFISSALYNDSGFLYSQISIGLFFRFIYDKRYAY
jgi:hypothetical protein